MPLVPNLVNKEWLVFINRDAFDTLYKVYLKNFEAKNQKRREYSVIWFRQIWRKLNYIAGISHLPSVSVLNIDNAYNPRRPLYGSLRFETKSIYSRHDGKYYNALIVDSFNLRIPYTDIYGGSRIILRENKILQRLTESAIVDMVQESVERILGTSREKVGGYEIIDGDCFTKNYAPSLKEFGAFLEIRMYDEQGAKPFNTICLMQRCDNGKYFYAKIAPAPELGDGETKFVPIKPEVVPKPIYQDSLSVIHSRALKELPNLPLREGQYGTNGYRLVKDGMDIEVDGKKLHSAISVVNKYGTAYHVVEDDHCYTFYVSEEGKKAKHYQYPYIFDELLDAVKTLPTPS